MKKNLLYLSVILLLILSCSKKQDKIQPIPPSQALSATEFITLKSGVVVEKRGDQYIWEGDITLSPAQFKALNESGTLFATPPKEVGPVKTLHPQTNLPLFDNTGNRTTPRAASIYPTPYNLWAMVRYVIPTNLSYDRRYIAEQAIAHWEANTNVRFYDATGQPTKDPAYGFDYPYIEFVNATVNQSPLGRQGGRQEIQLAKDQDIDAAIHEIGHAIGLFHEQNRYDRDDYITINTSNLKPFGASQFIKRTSDYYTIGAFDFQSVMLYPSIIKDTSMVYNTTTASVTKKDNSTWSTNTSLSNMDRAWANTFYLPFKPRVDSYRELDDIVYKPDNTVMTAQERLDLQAQLNNGNPNPPPAPPAGAVPIHVYYNSGTNVHDYVVDGSYYWNRSGWIYKGVYFYAFPSQIPGSTPVYRYYAYSADDNQWSISTSNDYNYWTLLNIPFYAYSTQVSGTVPIYLFKNVQTQKGHFLAQTYSYPWPVVNQNIAFYAFP